MLTFEIYQPLVVQKQTRFFKCNNSIRGYDPSKSDKESIIWQVKPFAPESPMTGAISLTLTFFREVPKSVSSTKRRQMLNHVILPVTRPDIDNYAYIVTNALKELVYQDDSQICELICRKFYGTEPKTVIQVRELLTMESGLECGL